MRLLKCLREFSPRAIEGASRASGLLLRELEALLCPLVYSYPFFGHRSGVLPENFFGNCFLYAPWDWGANPMYLRPTDEKGGDT